VISAGTGAGVAGTERVSTPACSWTGIIENNINIVRVAKSNFFMCI